MLQNRTALPAMTSGSLGAMVAVGSIGSVAGAYLMSPSLPIVGIGQVPAGYPQPGTVGGGASPNSNTPEGIKWTIPAISFFSLYFT